MTFFYDLNKKLDSIRATPEVKTQQLNERDMGKHNNATTGFAALAKKTGGGEKGARIAGAQLAKMRAKGQVEEEFGPGTTGPKQNQAGPLGRSFPDSKNYKTPNQDKNFDTERSIDKMSGQGYSAKNFPKATAGAATMDAQGQAEYVGRTAPGVVNKIKDKLGYDMPNPAYGPKPDETQRLAARYPAATQEAYNPNSVGAENRRGLEASHAANLKKKAAAGDAKAQAALQHLKDKKERQSNDFTSRMERESAGMAEGSGESVSFGEMINVVDEHEPKYYAELSVSEISDEQFKHKIISTYNKIIKKERRGNDFNARMERESVGMAEGGKPDFLDIDKDSNRTEPMKSAARSARGMKEGGIPMTPKQQKFAKLAKPFDKITFADKIVGAKKEVDEMLGQVAADAMKKAVRGRDRDMEEASTGNAFDYKNFKQPEKQKPTSFVHKGTYGTEYDGDKDDAKALATKKRAAADAGQAQRGRGRPKNNASADTGEVMKPDWSAFEKKVKVKPHTGKITKHKMVGEDDLDPEDQGEYDQEGAAAKDDIKTVLRHAQALQKVLGDNDNLPEWVQAKLAKIEGMMTAVDDYMQNQAGDDMDGEEEPIDERSVSKAQVKTMGAAAHNPKFAKKVGIKPSVAKEFNQADKGKDNSKLPEKAPKKKKEVDETTTSGSMATSGGAPKSSGGMSYGKGIYDSLNRELEGMISESMNISMNMSNDSHGGPSRNLTVTATDEDATALASILRMAGMGGGNDHMPHMNNGVVQPDEIKVIDFDDGTDDLAAELSNELHSDHDSDHSDTCPTCGSSDCGCDDSESMDEAYGDTDETLNSPDWPTDAEGTDDAMMYSGGLDGPKSTGQSTVPVIASQEDRQHAYEDAAALRRMMEMAGLPVSEAAAPGSNTVQDPAQQAQASTAASSGMKPSIGGAALKGQTAVKPSIGGAALKGQTAVKPATKLATPQHVDEPVKPVKEDQMAHSLMRELHNFKY